MMKKIDIGGLSCLCAGPRGRKNRMAYILYPVEGMLENWIEQAAEIYGVTIVVITGMDWESVFSPWPAKGVPAGSPDFKGESPEFLRTLQDEIIPGLEAALDCSGTPERTLFGVSMSGLFALWQWMVCDTFENIASLSGSFWYEGFMEWMASKAIPRKSGVAFFLLGNQESKSPVRAFASVGVNTRAIVKRLSDSGIKVKYEPVPGNHYSNPVPRLEAAFSAIYNPM